MSGEYGKERVVLLLEAEIIVSPLNLVTQERVLGDEISPESFSRKPRGWKRGGYVLSNTSFNNLLVFWVI